MFPPRARLDQERLSSQPFKAARPITLRLHFAFSVFDFREFSLARVITIADLVEEVKTESSKWIKTKGREFRNFHWQKGYGAFSIGQSQVPILKRYIARQKIHHKEITFQDEYRKFLKSYGIDYDER